MQEDVAIKLAAYLSHVAVDARIKRAMDAARSEQTTMPVSQGLAKLAGYAEKQANPTLSERFSANPMLFGTLGGAGLGALAGGGSAAFSNMFKNKRDRKSILNSALLGGLGGGALGLGGSAIYQGINAPENIKKKLITNEDVEAEKQKILSADPNKRKAYEDAQDPERAFLRDNLGVDMAGTDAKAVASLAGAYAGGKAGSKFIDNPRMMEGFLKNQQLTGTTTGQEIANLTKDMSLKQKQQFLQEAGRRGSSTPGMSTVSRLVGRSPDASSYTFRNNATGANQTINYNPQSLVRSARSDSGMFGSPRAGTMLGAGVGAAAPWVAEPTARLFGLDPLNRMQGRQTLADIDYQAELMARKAKGR